MTLDQNAASTLTPAGEQERSGIWLRLPCCDAAVHPVQIVGQHDGVMEITAPREPHATWVRRPADSTSVTLGWTDAGGTLALACQVLSDDGPTWSLQVIGSGDFMQRRRHLRVPTPAIANLMDQTADRIVQASIVDISESGMKCSFTDYVPNPSSDHVSRWAIRVDGAVLVVLAKQRWMGRVSPIEVQAGYEFLEVHEALAIRLRSHVMAQVASVGPAV